MIVVDTGPIVALINNREFCILLESRRGTSTELKFVRDVADGLFTVVDMTSADLERICELLKKYADLPLGTVDASVVAVAERFPVTAVATLDRRHFSIVQSTAGQLLLVP
jgi:predicted nucleic acid-binding protein